MQVIAICKGLKMDLKTVLGLLERITLRSKSNINDIAVKVVVTSIGSTGATPSVDLKSICAGVAWDNNTILIETDTPITTLTPEYLKLLQESVRLGESLGHNLQVSKLESELVGLKEENKRLRELLVDTTKVTSKKGVTPLPVINMDLPVGTFYNTTKPITPETSDSPYTTSVYVVAPSFNRK